MNGPSEGGERQTVETSALEEFSSDSPGDRECQQILQSWFSLLHQRSCGDLSEYRRDVWAAVGVLRSIRDALWLNWGKIDPAVKRTTPDQLWAWPGEDALKQRPGSWYDRSPAAIDQLDHALAEYLKRPWLQHNTIDISAINALLFTDLAVTIDDVKTGVMFGSPNWSYILSGGNMFAQLGLMLVGRVIGFLAAWVLLPAVAVALHSFGYEVGALITIGVWGLYVLYRVVMIPARWRSRSAKRKAAQKIDEVTAAMMKTWYAARHSTINPIRLRELIRDAEERGALVRPVLHTLLDRAIQRDPTALARG